MSLVWVNGALLDKSEARASLFDHGLLYGDGVWEPFRVFGGSAFRGPDHAAHLFAAADALGIAAPHTPAELLAAVDATVTANRRTEGYVRVIVTRGPGTIGPDPRKIAPQVFVTAEEYLPFPPELYGHALHAAVSPVRVDLANPANRVHTLGRPDVALAKRHALRAGCLEALLLAADATLAGATEGHIFLVKGGTIFAHPDFPPEVAATTVAAAARAAGVEVRAAAPSLADLLAADEAFLAGTSCGVIALGPVDGRDIAGGTEGPVTREVREGYRRLTRGGEGASI